MFQPEYPVGHTGDEVQNKAALQVALGYKFKVYNIVILLVHIFSEEVQVNFNSEYALYHQIESLVFRSIENSIEQTGNHAASHCDVH